MVEATQTPLLGLLAAFSEPQQVVDGVKALRADGYQRMETYSPFPIDGLAEALSLSDRRIPILTLLGGIIGAALGYGMQVYAVGAYPIDIGDRPLFAPQPFMLIVFELTILTAVFFCIGGMLVLNHLPRYHHPIFDVPGFNLASSDKFFLLILASDEHFDVAETKKHLNNLSPIRIDLVARDPEREESSG